MLAVKSTCLQSWTLLDSVELTPSIFRCLLSDAFARQQDVDLDSARDGRVDRDLDSARSSHPHSEDEAAPLNAPLADPMSLAQAVGAVMGAAATSAAAAGQQQSGSAQAGSSTGRPAGGLGTREPYRHSDTAGEREQGSRGCRVEEISGRPESKAAAAGSSAGGGASGGTGSAALGDGPQAGQASAASARFGNTGSSGGTSDDDTGLPSGRDLFERYSITSCSAGEAVSGVTGASRLPAGRGSSSAAACSSPGGGEGTGGSRTSLSAQHSPPAAGGLVERAGGDITSFDAQRSLRPAAGGPVEQARGGVHARLEELLVVVTRVDFASDLTGSAGHS